MSPFQSAVSKQMRSVSLLWQQAAGEINHPTMPSDNQVSVGFWGFLSDMQSTHWMFCRVGRGWQKLCGQDFRGNDCLIAAPNCLALLLLPLLSMSSTINLDVVLQYRPYWPSGVSLCLNVCGKVSTSGPWQLTCLWPFVQRVKKDKSQGRQELLDVIHREAHGYICLALLASSCHPEYVSYRSTQCVQADVVTSPNLAAFLCQGDEQQLLGTDHRGHLA